MTQLVSIRLGRIATARSGDKGAGANIGVIARSTSAYEYLAEHLTADQVQKFFAPMLLGSVKRYDWPAIGALNFILSEVLDGGGSISLRIDAQGKCLGQALLEMPLDVPAEILDGI